MGSFNLEIEVKLKIRTLKFDVCAIFRENSLSCFGEVGRSYFSTGKREQTEVCLPLSFLKKLKRTS